MRPDLARVQTVERRTFLAATAMFTGLVTRIPDEAWSRPALGSWDVRALVGHTCRAMTTVVDYLARPVTEAQIHSPAEYLATAHRADPVLHEQVAARGVAAGAALGPHPAVAVSEIVESATLALMTVAADQDPIVATALGGMRLSAYLPTRTLELTVHSLDLAEAVALPLQVPDEVMAVVLPILAGAALTNGQGPDLARALTGRAPLPDGFTVL